MNHKKILIQQGLWKFFITLLWYLRTVNAVLCYFYYVKHRSIGQKRQKRKKVIRTALLVCGVLLVVLLASVLLLKGRGQPDGVIETSIPAASQSLIPSLSPALTPTPVPTLTTAPVFTPTPEPSPEPFDGSWRASSRTAAGKCYWGG